MSYLDNIKAIATELASMSPRTQIELVKLCKDLCIQTKNYLVAFDETTLPALDARIEALETLTNNLSSELNIAEGNITANANAIATIQDTITTIQNALSNVYTKTQIDTMLASYYTKSDINTMFGTYYTKGEVNTLLNGYYPKTDTYNKTEVDTALSGKAGLSANNTFTGENNFTGDNTFNGYTEFMQRPTYNGNSLALDEDLDNKQDKLYIHDLDLEFDGVDANGDSIVARFYLKVINNSNTQLNTLSLLRLQMSKCVEITFDDDTYDGLIGVNSNNYLITGIQTITDDEIDICAIDSTFAGRYFEIQNSNSAEWFISDTVLSL